jgi:HAD superfamily hydrolase (TIGR01484 family)
MTDLTSLPMPIELIVCDVDGCLVPETSAAWDFEAFAPLVEVIRAANAGSGGLPPVTLCTGRPQPYVEALMKILDIRVPAICESGAIIYSLADNHARLGPGITHQQIDDLRELRRWMEHHLLDGRKDVVIQAGKEAQISLYSSVPSMLPPLHRAIEAEATARHLALEISSSHFYLNISLCGVDKGATLRAVLTDLGIDPRHTAAMGDTEGDLPLRKVCAWMGAPDNAREAIKKVADYVSPHAETRGAIDLFERIRRLR